ncbi:hypothetical protein GWO13_01335, partial [Candidatus Bathyarchaeota archaeon]|nr:hypothetical protein [Candidatus Bathyarchaeota archaeon]
MKKKPHKSGKNVNGPVLMELQALENLTRTIINADATPEAISRQLETLRLSKSESMALVDFLNDKAQRMLYGEHPIKMLELGERAFLIADQLDYEKGKAYGLLYTGVSQWFTSDLGESLKNLLKAKRIFVALDNEEGRIKALLYEACVYRT